ncbi:MAG TPA: alpha/beta hydrolase-fold protein [Thermoanaerobaculia bacterium]|nr:alpha/beta hydrolase-fold protein [Thermoanaerobaculia bacterium]
MRCSKWIGGLRPAVFFFFLAFAAAGEPVSLPRTSVLHLTAKSNGVGYKLYVSLPRDYETSNARYPVVYTLDADYSFAIAHNVVEHLADREHLRWAIVVSIAYDGPPQYRLNRTRDYTPTYSLESPQGAELQKVSGGGPKFRKFLVDELIPFIDGKYRTTKERVLAGHSYGGLFSTWMLLTTDAFSGYIIVSGSLWYDKDLLFKLEREWKRAPKARVYLSAGALENPVMGDDVKRMGKLLRRRSSLAVKDEVLENETHNSIFPGAFSRGLRFVMNGR